MALCPSDPNSTLEPAPVPHRELYPVKEARQLWGGLAQSSFYQVVHRQQVRLVKLGRRSYVPRAEILRIAAGTEQAPATQADAGRGRSA